MSLTVGLATGLWMFSFKTLNTWKTFFCCKGCQAPSTQKTYPGSSYEGSQQQFLLARPLITSDPNSFPSSQQPMASAVTIEQRSSRTLFPASSNGSHYITRSIGNNYNEVNESLPNNTKEQLYDISWKTSRIL